MKRRPTKTATDAQRSLKVSRDVGETNYDDYTDSDEELRRLWRIEENTKIFASMCPDEILDHYDDYSSRIYHTTLMLGDVSGFTELAEKYTNLGKSGPSKLTETLNNYIGAMVQEILCCKGDVLKFSGDAFIVMWKVKDNMAIGDVAVKAIQTACVIKKHFGTYETDVGVTLKVKLAIASGKITFTSIGDPDKASYYIMTGKPVWEVKSAEALCRGGDILVAPSCWQWANPNEYIHSTLPDGIHTLVIESSLMWQHSQERYDFKRDYSMMQQSTNIFPHYSAALNGRKQPENRKIVNEKKALIQRTVRKNVLDSEIETVDYSLRPKVIEVAKQHLQNELRSYILPPVIRSVEHDEPLEYLTEMRRVVIVFVNVLTSNIAKRKLIVLVDAAYKLVCGIVGEMQGCVNKTSLFDKDLMFLCIFGLRGEKHELECQIGLICASKIRKSLNSMISVISVSVAVTTGITYCGVVGHTLRREYTVIGTTVNKAARLMCAYTNKVICDRDSFLHSRLEARHFVLQEPKILKGLTNIGPIYEFLEEAQVQESMLGPDQLPILARKKELKIFKDLLENMRNFWKMSKTKNHPLAAKNTLIIKGEPRIGKSRLLDAMKCAIPEKIPCNHITLIPSDYQVPYTLIHLIFGIPLAFDANESTSKHREQKLSTCLGKIRDPHYLCALNRAFNVNFVTSARYRSLEEVQKNVLLRKLIARLTRACFDRLWVVMVDDAENIDSESISLLPTIIKQDRALFVFTFGKNVITGSNLDPLIIEGAMVIELTGIDKWFHAALVCQMLNVVAIPPELEKVIQKRSMGNPGWIESYLVSLIQVGGIVIKKMTIKHLCRMGYVIPTEKMVDRLTSKEQESTDVESKEISERDDGWNMYSMSFAESATSVSEQSRRDSGLGDLLPEEIEDQKRVPVCIIPQNFVPEDVDTEITMDVMILKLFDSLTPLEQFLLKCASVLGETINRNMLENLMEGTTDREIAFAVSKLFEIRILGCAAGDFKRSLGPLMFFRHLRKRKIDIEIRCGCTGLPTRDSLVNLPKYASCGLMRFKMDYFRDSTYRLLTENQKVDFHTKALKYLRKNTRRCDACGSGQFANLLGRIYPESMRIENKKKMVHLGNITDLSDYGDTVTENIEDAPVKKSDDHVAPSCMSFCRSIVKSPTRTFSNFDFTNCQCDIILNNFYSQMLDHYRGIQGKDKTLTTIIEFVELLLRASNVPQARKLLNEAEQILIEMFKPGRDDELITLPYLNGKIKTLQARCELQCGLINEAHRSLDQAIKSLGWHFPKTTVLVRLKSSILLQEQKLALTCLRDWKVGIAEDDAANYNDQFANCLAQMFIVFRTKGMMEHARLAAIWGLNVAVASSKDFSGLCSAYENMIITAHYFRYRSIIPILENDAINICIRQSHDLELHELEAIAKLYSSIFSSRSLRGEMVEATKLGFVALGIARNACSVTLRISILPKLIHLLMAKLRHDEVLALLRELEVISIDEADKTGRTWYYALCVDLQLDTAIFTVPFTKCERYYQEEGDTMINLNDPQAEKSYFTSMWLWYVRMDEWEAARVWKTKQTATADKINEYTVAASMTILRELEGLIISYVHDLDQRNTKAVEKILIDIEKNFKHVEKLLQVVKINLDRYVLMKSYYNMVRLRTKTGLRLVQRSRKIAEKMGNKLISEWADHCEKAWTGSLSGLQTDVWKERCKRVSRMSQQIREQELHKTISYTLPLPASVRNLW